MCGIAAWSGKNVKDFDLNKLGILGIFNEKRGTHSCGMAVDFKIGCGVDNTKVFKDFMQTASFKAPVRTPVVIAHTRHSTGGLKDVYNAHPFGFGLVKKHQCHKFVGVHNGSLMNHSDLAEKYGVSTTGVKSDNTTIRHKIDSEILLESIYKSGNYNVLNDYKGAAALVFTSHREPNVMYCYHGASKSYAYSTDGMEEERPLFYWQESKNSVYVSSMENSLIAIGAKPNQIKSFELNRVYKITDGNVNTAIKYKVDRTNVYKNKSAATRTQEYYDTIDAGRDAQCSLPLDNNSSKKNYANRHACGYKRDATAPGFKHNIYKDAALEGDDTFIQFWRLRYRRNGHAITGCYGYIKNYGFYELGVDVNTAEKELGKLAGKVFNNVEFNHVPLTFKIKDKNYIPFKAEDITNPGQVMYYFVNGIRVKSRLDYTSIMKKGAETFNTSQLSMASAHPIMDDSVKTRNFNAQQVYHNGILATGTFAFLGCNKIYTFKEGNCINIKPNEKYKMLTIGPKTEKETKVINLPAGKVGNDELLNKAKGAILDNELQQAKKDLSQKEIQDEEDMVVKNIIFASLFQTYDDLSKGLKNLNNFKTNKIAVKTMDAINGFIDDIDEIMVEDLNIEINE